MSNPQQLFVDVILPLAVPNLYTYHIDAELQHEPLQKGMRVVVQFGARKLYTALVAEVHTRPVNHYETKAVLAILDNRPVVFEWQLDFWQWMAEYYLCTMGEVYSAALPGGLRPEGQTRVYPAHLPETGVSLNPDEEQVYHILKNNPGIPIGKLQSLLEKKQAMPLLKRMMDKGLLCFEENINRTYKPRQVEYIQLHESLQNEESLGEMINRLERRAPKQSDALLGYLQLSGQLSEKTLKAVTKQELMEAAQVSAAIIESLSAKNVFTLKSVETTRFSAETEPVSEPYRLSVKQRLALEEIEAGFQRAGVALLHGVTSSGKTEIYIHLIQKELEKGKQVLYLLPEIALTTQIITRLRNVFGARVGVYHSKYSDNERIEVWNNLLGHIAEGALPYEVILGVRSSVFLPFSKLGLVIVDEEHENTYKQQDPAPRYHARDAAIVCASVHQAKVLLGSATPSLETYFNAKNGKYALVELLERHLDIKLPETELVNMQQARKRKQVNGHFSKKLIDEIQVALEMSEQVILFQNRRGFAPYLECADCGWIPQCRHCDVSLTYHKGIDKLNCHYCGFSVQSIVQCQACGSTNMQTKGFGTEKIEDDLSLIFPQASIGRLDLDSTRRKDSFEIILDEFASGKLNVLIGTQMVSKGLDFDNVSVVGIMNADSMLHYPDFRAYERSFQLMAQVSGRAGRKKKQGKVVIQTSTPENIILQQVVQNNYKAFFDIQLEERKVFKYPPYCRLIGITLKHQQRETVQKAARMLAEGLRQVFGEALLGPQPPVVGKIQNLHLQHMLLKLSKGTGLAQQKSFLLGKCRQLKQASGFSSLVVSLDVDPQ
ncbi:MAG: primosomal protein N' [Bacteroidota bacterium]|nr:MAG: primosomal protein N' [Bacteroidota bacterium]